MDNFFNDLPQQDGVNAGGDSYLSQLLSILGNIQPQQAQQPAGLMSLNQQPQQQQQQPTGLPTYSDMGYGGLEMFNQGGIISLIRSLM